MPASSPASRPTLSGFATTAPTSSRSRWAAPPPGWPAGRRCPSPTRPLGASGERSPAHPVDFARIFAKFLCMSEDALRVRHLDAASLRAMAHPLRMRIIGALRVHGPATASGLAERLGVSSGLTSYHLRALAAAEFVEDDPDHPTKGRERWWRSAQDMTSWTPGAADYPDAAAAEEWLAGYAARRAMEWVDGWLDRRADDPPAWQEVSGTSDYLIDVTPDELRVINEQITELLRPHLPPGGEREDGGGRRRPAPGPDLPLATTSDLDRHRRSEQERLRRHFVLLSFLRWFGTGRDPHDGHPPAGPGPEPRPDRCRRRRPERRRPPPGAPDRRLGRHPGRPPCPAAGQRLRAGRPRPAPRRGLLPPRRPWPGGSSESSEPSTPDRSRPGTSTAASPSIPTPTSSGASPMAGPPQPRHRRGLPRRPAGHRRPAGAAGRRRPRAAGGGRHRDRAT